MTEHLDLGGVLGLVGLRMGAAWAAAAGGFDGGGSDGSALVSECGHELVGGLGAGRAERLEHSGGGRAQLGRGVGELGEGAV